MIILHHLPSQTAGIPPNTCKLAEHLRAPRSQWHRTEREPGQDINWAQKNTLNYQDTGLDPELISSPVLKPPDHITSFILSGKPDHNIAVFWFNSNSKKCKKHLKHCWRNTDQHYMAAHDTQRVAALGAGAGAASLQRAFCDLFAVFCIFRLGPLCCSCAADLPCGTSNSVHMD